MLLGDGRFGSTSSFLTRGCLRPRNWSVKVGLLHLALAGSSATPFPIPSTARRRPRWTFPPHSSQDETQFFLLNVLLLAFLPAVRSPELRRQAVALAIPALGFTLIWLMLSNEMNYRMRFQSALVPLVLIPRQDWSTCPGWLSAAGLLTLS